MNVNKANLWHLHFGHINQNRLKQVQTMGIGIEQINEKEFSLCESCILSEQHNIKFLQHSQTRSNVMMY
jgi:hypothetical protein